MLKLRYMGLSLLLLSASFAFAQSDAQESVVDASVDSQVSAAQQSVSNKVEELQEEVADADTRGGGEETRLKAQLEQREADKRSKAVADAGQDLKDKLNEPSGKELSLLPAIAETVAGEIVKRWPFVAYASLRINMGYSDGSVDLADGGSRIGVYYNQPLPIPGSLFGRAEGGINVVDQVSFLTTGDANSNNGETGPAINQRLLYLGYEYEDVRGLVGKNWAPYYDVAGWTDNFAIFGARGLGVYNAGTDGGGSGTGRADNSGQLRGQFKGFHLALQAQTGTQIPHYTDKRYSFGLGASLIHKLKNGWSIGAAYNYAQPDEVTDEMRAGGFQGDDESLLLAFRYSRDKLRFATGFANMRNHMTDDQDEFFNGWGWEVYSRYDVKETVRLVAGLNISHPRDDEYKGDFREVDYLAGVHYLFGRRKGGRHRYSDDMIYLMMQLAQGRLADGSTTKSTVAIGFRKKFMK